MTREKAIEILKNLWTFPQTDIGQALEMAIQSLEKEPCDDCISRQAALEAMYELCDTEATFKENPWRDNPHIDAITDAIDALPYVTQKQNMK